VICSTSRSAPREALVAIAHVSEGSSRAGAFQPAKDRSG
jgi:hypothetical protein